MSAIEEAWIEAVARALCKADGWTSRDVAHAWKAYRSLARAAIRALAPLIIERCAEVVANSHKALPYDGIDTDYETGIVDAITEAVAAIRALIQKEADHA